MNEQEILSLFNRGNSSGKKWLQYATLVIAIMGTVAFACFILEEGMQTLMFASFNYKNVEDYNGLAQHLKVMKSHEVFAGSFIKYVGWLSPISYPAYLEYDRANRAYIKSIESTLKKKQKNKAQKGI